MKKSFLLIATIIFALNGHSQTWDEVIKAVASDRDTDSFFGYSVSISGDRAVVGANEEKKDASGANPLNRSGAAYIFKFDGTNWIEEAKLVASDRNIVDNFGNSVSISGNKVIVGAHQEDEDASGTNTLPNSGSAYIFSYDGTSWVEEAKLVASDRAIGDLFGYSVSISGDKAVVGAYQEDEDVSGANTLNNSGSAYIFSYDGTNWTEEAKLTAFNRAADDYFGHAVSISENRVVVGAHREDEDNSESNSLNNSGSAYIFSYDGTNWVQEAKLVASDRADGDLFGYSVSIDESKAIIGAYNEDEDVSGTNTLGNSGSAYIFNYDGTSWVEEAKLVASDRNVDDLFGYSVSIDENKAIVGAIFQKEDVSGNNSLDYAGAAYVFAFDGTNWSEEAKIVASDRAEDDSFGESVSISDDNIIIGTIFESEDATGANTLSGAGSAYIFKFNCLAPSTSISVSGNTLTVDETGAFYQWIDCDNGNSPINGATNQSYTPTTSGNFAVEVTVNNCSAISGCTSLSLLGINENTTHNFSIYPNPVKEKLILEFSQQYNTDYIITDHTGKVVEKGKIASVKHVIDTSNLTEGMYLINIEGEIQKFIRN